MPENFDPTASYVLLKSQLERRGFKVRTYRLGRQHYVEYRHPAGKVWLTRTQHFSYPLNHGAVMEMADNKSLALEWVSQFAIAEAGTVALGDDDDLPSEAATKMLKQHGRVVVKPESSSGSNGLTLDVTTQDMLHVAIEKAREVNQFSENVLIQEQVAGDEIRFAVLDGKVLAIIHRQPARVVGDGVSSVATLIARENKQRDNVNEKSMVKYPPIESLTERREIDKAYVPDDSEVVLLADSTMIYGGASVFNVTSRVHPSYTAFVEKIIGELGAAFLVVDLFARDFTQPMTADNTYFNEFNKAPALKMFYSDRDGKNYDIVQPLADAIEKRLR